MAATAASTTKSTHMRIWCWMCNHVDLIYSRTTTMTERRCVVEYKTAWKWSKQACAICDQWETTNSDFSFSKWAIYQVRRRCLRDREPKNSDAGIEIESNYGKVVCIRFCHIWSMNGSAQPEKSPFTATPNGRSFVICANASLIEPLAHKSVVIVIRLVSMPQRKSLE